MSMKDAIEQSLVRIRPYLQVDGGDVELVQVTEEGIVEVRLTGSCASCPMSLMTLRAGIERAMMRDLAGVIRVEQVK